MILKSLIIENFATFQYAEIYFHPGNNVIIGETGSGKSLILSAIKIIFGFRAQKTFIRNGALSFKLSAEIDLEGRNISIYRELDLSGKNISTFNNKNVRPAFIKDIFTKHIKIIGQNESQKIFSSSFLLNTIDSTLPECVISEFELCKTNFLSTKKILSSLIIEQNEIQKRIIYYKSCIEDYNRLLPTIEEEQELITRRDSYKKNTEKINLFNRIRELFEANSEDCLARKIRRTSVKISNFYPNLENQLMEIVHLIENTSEMLVSLEQEIISSDEYENALERLKLYKNIQEKYFLSTAGFLDEFKTSSEKLKKLNLLSTDIDRYKALLDKQNELLVSSRENLILQRSYFIKKIEAATLEYLKNLGMPHCSISFELTYQNDLTASPIVSIKITINPGEGIRSLRVMASGGELSRIFLALSRASGQETQENKVLIFDEIDSGISGQTGILMGEMLNNFSQHSQVITLSHLPQVAHSSNKLFVASKAVSEKTNRTFSKLVEITSEIEKNRHINQMNSIPRQ